MFREHRVRVGKRVQFCRNRIIEIKIYEPLIWSQKTKNTIFTVKNQHSKIIVNILNYTFFIWNIAPFDRISNVSYTNVLFYIDWVLEQVVVPNLFPRFQIFIFQQVTWTRDGCNKRRFIVSNRYVFFFKFQCELVRNKNDFIDKTDIFHTLCLSYITLSNYRH